MGAHSRGKYAPYAAQDKAERRGRRTKGSKIDEVELADLVQAKLCVKWSPMQISDHLATTFPDRAEMWRVSRNDLPGAACAGPGSLSCWPAPTPEDRSRCQAAETPHRQVAGQDPGHGLDPLADSMF